MPINKKYRRYLRLFLAEFKGELKEMYYDICLTYAREFYHKKFSPEKSAKLILSTF